MENRIKIGDVWYVKEDQTAPAKKDVEIIYSREMQIDLNDYILIASVLEKDDSFSMASIDKKSLDGEKLHECMDNKGWLKGVANRESEPLLELRDDDKDTQEAIIILCDKMQEFGWI